MRKIFALGIMLLFLGMTISSTTGINLEKQSIKPLSSGNILYVGGSGPGNYSEIQDAIDDASDGDTVFVFHGTYKEKLLVSKSINLIGENKETTKIIGIISSAIIEICDNNVLVEGFTFTSNYGSGILVQEYENIRINDNIFINLPGKGIWLDSVRNCIITNNIISYIEGEGVHIYHGFNITINGNLFSNTSYGIHSYRYSKCNISNNLFVNNTNGIRAEYSHITTEIHNNSFLNNGCGIVLIDCYCKIYYNNISNNDFCGIIIENCIYNEIFNNLIFGNEFGIKIDNSEYIIVTYNTIMDNEGRKDLGLIFDGIVLNWNCYHNEITFNNFIDDDIGFEVFFPRTNKIRHNYYTKWSNKFPKPIIGFKLLEFRKISFLIYSIPIPWLIFDWFPASEPYDIEV